MVTLFALETPRSTKTDPNADSFDYLKDIALKTMETIPKCISFEVPTCMPLPVFFSAAVQTGPSCGR